MDIIKIASSADEMISIHWPRRVFGASSTLVVPPKAPARAVAEIVENTDTTLILVAEDDFKVCGVVIPSLVISEFNRHKRRRVKSFLDVVDLLQNDPTEVQREFHHEWLSGLHTRMYWCEPGKHATPNPVCHNQPGTPLP